MEQRENNKAPSFLDDDSDMKFADDLSELAAAFSSDDSEETARRFRAHRDNGNLERAQRIGRLLANELLQKESAALWGIDDVESMLMIRQRKLLFVFVADQVLEELLPDSLLAQSAQNTFYNKLKRVEPALYDAVRADGAFSLYLVCCKDGLTDCDGIGKVFAGLVGRAEDYVIRQFGETLYKYFRDVCEKIVAAERMIPITE